MVWKSRAATSRVSQYPHSENPRWAIKLTLKATNHLRTSRRKRQLLAYSNQLQKKLSQILSSPKKPHLLTQSHLPLKNSTRLSVLCSISILRTLAGASTSAPFASSLTRSKKVPLSSVLFSPLTPCTTLCTPTSYRRRCLRVVRVLVRSHLLATSRRSTILYRCWTGVAARKNKQRSSRQLQLSWWLFHLKTMFLYSSHYNVQR